MADIKGKMTVRRDRPTMEYGTWIFGGQWAVT
ncbi:hypothetical protein COLO4_20546 [Corchorus olitorius]|uniref:Uncharacterized protein n=1 Tax=Corchorus olitorius TaxID=93759 RepID=A0A1R3IZ43_9ROSI|nr:hypothetical protein COLO4_20546 [Corchorus olitorius]